MISFRTIFEDTQLIKAIAKRAHNGELPYDEMTANMDITAVHCNGVPLRLQDLLDAPDSVFFHDVYGIARNLDRSTGQLLNNFLPRSAAPL